jgi:hypothetical protein
MDLASIETRTPWLLQHGYAKPDENGRRRPEYSTWNMMIQRCHNPNNKAFGRYGGKGVTVCDRWRFGDGEVSGFQCFISDMSDRPTPGHSIDRCDNAKGYEPSNCRWATRVEQQNNTTANRWVEFEGQRMTLVQASKAAGIAYTAVRLRLGRGWDVQRALNTPIDTKRHKKFYE